MKNGGAAFPVFGSVRTGNDYDFLESGMTLRDYFAGQTLEYCLCRFAEERMAAEEAYKIADAMLAAREKPNAKN